MQPAPSAVYHYSDAGGHLGHHNKVNAIFQAAKKDLLKIIELQARIQTKYTGVLVSISMTCLTL